MHRLCSAWPCELPGASRAVLTGAGSGGPPQLRRTVRERRSRVRWTSMVAELEEVPMSIVLRREALLVRMGVEDRRRSAVVAVG